MAFTKTQSVEKSSVVKPEQAKQIQSNLRKVGKTSAADLTDEERNKVFGSQ